MVGKPALSLSKALAGGDRGERGRQSCPKLNLLFGDGMLEFQKLSMQQISSIARETREIFKSLAG
jgi:hypothetical protein